MAAFGWAKIWKKKDTHVQEREPICMHDLPDKPPVPMLPMCIRRRLVMSWTKLQDTGLLRTANQIHQRMTETLTAEQMRKMDQDFSFVEANEGNVSLAGGKPFKEKCYYLLNTMDKLVALLHCVSCLNDKVDETLHGNIPSRDHFDILNDHILWALAWHNNQAFTNRYKSAWRIFFECIWDIMEGSLERYKIKEIELKKQNEIMMPTNKEVRFGDKGIKENDKGKD